MRFRHTCTPFAYMTILNNYKGLYPRLYRFSTHHPVAIWNGIGIEVPLLSAHTKQWRCRWYGMMMINKGTGELFVCFFLSAIASTKPGAFVFYSPSFVGAHTVWWSTVAAADIIGNACVCWADSCLYWPVFCSYIGNSRDPQQRHTILFGHILFQSTPILSLYYFYSNRIESMPLLRPIINGKVVLINIWFDSSVYFFFLSFFVGILIYLLLLNRFNINDCH